MQNELNQLMVVKKKLRERAQRKIKKLNQENIIYRNLNCFSGPRL